MISALKERNTDLWELITKELDLEWGLKGSFSDKVIFDLRSEGGVGLKLCVCGDWGGGGYGRDGGE